MKNKMVIPASFLLLAGLAMGSCSTLSSREIKALERVVFDPLRIEPDIEPNDLRIDVIRQTDQQMVGNTLQTVDVPNDPLGLNLGNGLFYDLNENFSLRLDYLLDFEHEEAFELKETTTPRVGSNFTVYTLANDSLTTTRASGTRSRYRYHRSGPPDSLSFMRKNNLKYTVVQRDSALVYRNGRRVTAGIYKEDNENFYFQRRRKKLEYRLVGHEVHLRDHYIVALTDQNRTLGIYRPTRKGKKRLYTIERSQDKLFVYNPRLRGKKIEFSGRSLLIFREKRPIATYTLESPKKMPIDQSTP